MALSYLIYRDPQEPTYFSNSSADHLTYSSSRRPIDRRRQLCRLRRLNEARDSDAQLAVEPFITLHQKPLNASSCKATPRDKYPALSTNASSQSLSGAEGYY